MDAGVFLKAMVLRTPGPAESSPLVHADVGIPAIGDGGVLVKVEACGVCRTDLHIAEGDLPVMKENLIPGHEVVGRIVDIGRDVHAFKKGDRVGVPWLRWTCGKCEFCLSGRENLCREKRFTGYSDDGGYSEFVSANADYIFKLSESLPPELAAPYLCSGIIGYRAFKLACPSVRDGARIGIFGFGGSAHLTVQLASKLGARAVVVSRGKEHLELARDLGAYETYVSGEADLPGLRLDSAIVFAPSGRVVLQALEAIKPGGSVAVPAIHMDAIPEMDYARHLFGEKKVFSVEANTRSDAREFLAYAERFKLKSIVETFSLEGANMALSSLKGGSIRGAAAIKF